MSEVPRWVERQWSFELPVEQHPALRARLWGTPARVHEVTGGLPRDVLTRRVDGKWSIQEHAGHLFDLEELGMRRLAEYLAGAETLSPADMTNARTEEARHNEGQLADIVGSLRAARWELVARLDALQPADFARVAVHPRLRRPLRLVDFLLFLAEHDDHHLARMRELRRALTS